MSIFIAYIFVLNTIIPVFAQEENERWFDDKDVVSGYSHSICVVGDTQILTNRYHDDFPKIYDWILDNKEEKKIEYVIGVGDICHTSVTEEWEVAKAGISKLDGVIPYSLAKGSENHDASYMLNKYFYNDTYMDGFGGFYKEGQVENAWRVFRAGNIDYLNVVLDFGASDAVLEWAGEVIAAHPNHKVIINTHCYLYSDGELQNYTHSASPHYSEVGTGSKNNGNEIWDKLVSKYENIFLVLCGHYVTEQIVVNQRQGIHGNTVTEMLVNPQGVDADEGATGMVATLYFSEDGKNMDVEYYSTVRNKYFLKSNQMSIKLPKTYRPMANYRWQGLDGEDKLKYDVEGDMNRSSVILKPDSSEYSGNGFEYINAMEGGKAEDDYYLKFDYKGSASHHLSYCANETESELEKNFLVFKYNIYGNNGNLSLRALISDAHTPVLYCLNEKEYPLLKSEIWNSCMIFLDINNQECYGYINGVKTHTEDISNTLLAIDATYTNLIDIGIDEFELIGYEVFENSDYLCIDDIAVISSPYEVLPEDIIINSDSVFYGDYIISSNDSVNEIESKNNTIIICNSQSGCVRNRNYAVQGDKVSVEYNDSLYGMMYENYVATNNIKNKFYDGSGAPSTSYFGFSASNGVSYENNSLGGKAASDFYAAIHTGSGDQTAYTGKKNKFDTRYCTISFNVYGAGLRDVFARVNSTVKPRLLTNICTTYLNADMWNNVFIVFDSITKVCKSYINGEFVYEANIFDATEEFGGITRDGDTFKFNGTDVTSAVDTCITDIRIAFANDTTAYFDDYATMYTDFEPKPIADESGIKVENGIIKNNFIIINSDVDSARLILPHNVTSMRHNDSAWIEDTLITIGDNVKFINSMPYGNVYSETYVVSSADDKLTIATQSSGMDFIQGGFPWIPDENGTTVNEDGIKGTNVEQTGAGNDVLVFDAENVYGSKINMKEIMVGYNSKSSTLSRYQAIWNKSDIEKQYPYLVLKADVAFPKENHSTGIRITTNKGGEIGVGFDYNENLKNKVNHYVWVYDVTNGWVEEFLNGEPLYSSPKKAVTQFISGEYNNVRFQIAGVTKMVDDTIGTYEGGLSAYVQNLELYGCAAPLIHKPFIPENTIIDYYVTAAEDKQTIKEFKEEIASSGATAYVYSDSTFNTELDDTDLLGAGNCIVIERNGLYSYYSVCSKPDSDSDYAVNYVEYTDDCNVGVVGLTKTDSMTILLAEYDNNHNLVSTSYAECSNIDIGFSTDITLPDISKDSYIVLYVWDSLQKLVPLGQQYSIR